MPRISVLMPVRNGEEFLQEALDSVLSQQGADFECLVVDDGSTDRTPAILAACQDHRLRVVHNLDHGLVNALNFGLAQARGEYIARMDADDVCLPGRLARQAAVLDGAPHVAMVHTAVRVIDSHGQGSRVVAANPATADAYRAVLLDEQPGSPIIHPTVMVRRKSLVGVGGYRHSPACEDHELWLRVVDSWTFRALPEVLLLYRQHLGGVSRINSAQQAISHVMNCVAYRIRQLYGVDLFEDDPVAYATLRQRLGDHANRVMPLVVAAQAARRHVKQGRWWPAAQCLFTVMRGGGLALLTDRGARRALLRLQERALADYAAGLVSSARQE